MLKIRIIQPGHQDVFHEVPGTQALIGRSADNDVVIDERYISGRHAKVLAGLIIVDLDSTNGTFVDGTRVREATLLREGAFQLGGEVGDVLVEVSADAFGGAPEEDMLQTYAGPSGGDMQVDGDLAAERRRNAQLVAELDRLRTQAALPTQGKAPQGQVDRSEVEFARDVLQDRVGQLEADKATLQASLERLKVELEEARAQPAAPSGDLFFNLQAEIQRLKSEFEKAQAQPGPTGDGMEVLRRAAAADIEGTPEDLRKPMDEFLILELFRFLRQGEQVLTRFAGPLLQLDKTVVSEVDSNLRQLVLGVIDGGGAADSRADFLQYVQELRRWLEVSVDAYPAAAQRFARDLVGRLSEQGLTADDPIPKMKRLAGQADGELWVRARRTLDELSDEAISDQVQRHAQAVATDMLDGEG